MKITSNWVRVGLRLPPEINKALEEAAKIDYMTKNQKAIEIFLAWLKTNSRGDYQSPA